MSGTDVKRTLLAVAATAGLGVGVAAPAHANDLTVTLRTPSGAAHAVLTWDDSVDTLCLTLRSGSASAYADADLRLVAGGGDRSLSVRPGRTRACTGNLSIAEDRLAEMRVYGGSNTFHSTSGWRSFYT